MELVMEDHTDRLYLKRHIATVNDGVASVGISGVMLLVSAGEGSEYRQIGTDLIPLIEDMVVEALKRGSGRQHG